MPHTNWNDLTCSHFAVTNPDWIPGLEATVRVHGTDVSLSIDGTLEIDPQHVSSFKMLISGWIEHREDIAQQTEEHLDRFLPGRHIGPDDLLIWGITLRVDEGTIDAASFFYRVGGEYESDAYKLDQFDSRSVVELSCCIDGGVVDWDDLDIATTNDFD